MSRIEDFIQDKATQQALYTACVRLRVNFDDFLIYGEIRYKRDSLSATYYLKDILVMTHVNDVYYDCANLQIDVSNPIVLLSDVIGFLNEYEQIKDTVIPIRLKEHFATY